MASLSVGAIAAIERNQKLDYLPIVQVIAIKKIQAKNQQNTIDRYRLVISDSQYYQQAMLGMQLNELVTSQELTTSCIVQLDEYLCNKVQGRSIVIILKLQVVGTAEGNIGKPQNIDEIHKPGEAGAPEPAQPQAQPARAPAAKPQPGRSVANNPAGAPSFPNRNQPKQQVAAPQKANPAQQKSSSQSSGGKPIVPIDGLNPYQNRWTIRARVTRKPPKRSWQNAQGSGTLFSFDVLDIHGGEIRITCFKDLADKYYNEIEEGKIYEISGGQIKFANKKFNPLKHDYEITLDNSSEIVSCEGDIAVPVIEYNFEQIANLTNYEKNSSVDVIGVVLNVGEAAQLPSKNGKELIKRDVVLADDSGSSIRCTVWNEQAAEFDLPVGDILAIRGAKVSDFGGRTISVSFASLMQKNPELPEAHRLRGWYDETSGTVYNSLTHDFGEGSGGSDLVLPRKTLAEVRDENLGSGGQPFKFCARLTTLMIPPNRDAYWYAACPGKTAEGNNCSKRVTETSAGWHCDKCDLVSPNPRYRYIFSARCADFTGNQWVTCFDEVGTKLLGHSAPTLAQVKDENIDQFTKILKESENKTFTFRLAVKEENYKGEMKMKYSAINIKETNFAEESRELIQLIQQIQL